MTSGYQALHSGTALLDLSDRGRIIATGEDRKRLIHALTTNHVQQLEPGQFCYAFFLTAQGRIIADAYIHCREESLWIDTEPETRETLLQHIEHYIIADDVTLEDATARTFCVSVEGPEAPALWGKVEAGLDRLVSAAATFTGAPGFRLLGDAAEKERVLALVESLGAVPASAGASRVVRIEHARPRYGEDIGPATLAQETGRADALHFQKGCYLGQEIVERIRSRTTVNRILAGLAIDGEEAFENGEELLFEGNKAGKITSAAFSPVRGKVVAIGMVRLPLAVPGTVLNVRDTLATVTTGRTA